MMPKYSFIIPVYNRPEEINELLESLGKQTFGDFEVIVIEDGSKINCEEICKSYQSKFDLTYLYKENEGQGFARNSGFKIAKGLFFIQLDSDAILPEKYLKVVDESLALNQLDAFGGPDTAHSSFSDVQKAINYSMTSFFTTGGIRGKSNNAGGKFHPRSFNFGISRKVWEVTKGYNWTRKAEDIEFSIRIIENGFKVGLIPEAFIYHKRRTSFRQFAKQLEFFGRGRINLGKFFPKELKIIHFFPLCFSFCLILLPIIFLLNSSIFIFGLTSFLIYFGLIFIDSFYVNKSFKIAFLSIWACIIQLTSYGFGFFKEMICK